MLSPEEVLIALLLKTDDKIGSNSLEPGSSAFYRNRFEIKGEYADVIWQKYRGDHFPFLKRKRHYVKDRWPRAFNEYKTLPDPLKPITVGVAERYRNSTFNKSGIYVNYFNLNRRIDMEVLAKLCPSLNSCNEAWRIAHEQALKPGEKDMFYDFGRFIYPFDSRKLREIREEEHFEWPETILRNTLKNNSCDARTVAGYLVFDRGYGTIIPVVVCRESGTKENQTIVHKRTIYFYYVNGYSKDMTVIRQEDAERIAKATLGGEDTIHFAGSSACLTLATLATSEEDFTAEESFALRQLRTDLGLGYKQSQKNPTNQLPEEQPKLPGTA